MDYPDLPDPVLNQAFFEMLSRSETPCILVQEGTIEWMNDAVEQLTGFDKNDILGHFPKEFGEMINQVDSHSIDIDEVRREVIAEQKNVSDALMFKTTTKEGEIRWLKFEVYPFLHDKDHYSVIMLQDITAFKEKEEKLQLLMNLSIVAFAIEQDGSIMYINPAFTSIMGYTEDDVKLWAPYQFFSYVHGEDKPVVDEWIHTLVENKDQGGITHSFFRVKIKSGKVRWIEIFVERGYYNGMAARVVIIFDVTEKHMLEQRLVESDEQFRVIAQQSSLGIAIIQDGKFAFVNEMVAGILGQSATELSNAAVIDYFDVLPEQMRIDIENRYREHRLGHVTGDGNYVSHVPVADGRKLYEVATKNIIISDRIAIMFTVHDVTGLFEAQQELKESEEKFRTIAERSIVGIILVQDGLVKYVNEQSSRVYGYPVQEILGWSSQHLSMKVHPADRPSIGQFFDDRNDRPGDTAHEAIFKIMTKSGDTRWIQAHNSSVPYQGRNAEMIIISDITEKKESELAIAQSEFKYRQLFEESADGILLIDNKGKFLECNSTAEKLLNLSKNEIIGKNYKDFQQYLITDLSFFRTYLKKVNQGQATEPFELEAISGSRGPMWLRGSTTRINYGKERANQLILHDITEKKNLESMLQQENEKLRHLDNMRKNFIFTATHELKTPLVSIYGASDFLMSMMPETLDPNIRNLITIIHKGAERLKALVDNMLDSSRMDTGNFNIISEEIDMVEVVNQAVASLDYLVQVSGQEIILDMPESCLRKATSYAWNRS